MKLKVDKLMLNVPHPAAFALHRFIISSRRIKEEKRLKERQEALRILNCLIAKGEDETIINLFNSTPRRWRTKAIKALENSEGGNILTLLK